MRKTQRIVFCDFDGTITASESLEAVLRQFNPEAYQEVIGRIKSRQSSIRDGVREMIRGIASDRYPEILSFVQKIPIRPGFETLLDLLDEQGVPFIVLSGGLRGMVEARLGKLVKRVHRIIAADIDTSQAFLRVFSDQESDTELVAKAEVMKTFSFDESIVIGDGITDIEMARHGSRIFARDALAEFLDQAAIAYTPWSDFFDICTQLEGQL